jgi:hypothetical protein
MRFRNVLVLIAIFESWHVDSRSDSVNGLARPRKGPEGTVGKDYSTTRRDGGRSEQLRENDNTAFDPEEWIGKSIVDVCHRLGKPDVIAPIQSKRAGERWFSLAYARLNRSWQIREDGSVVAVSKMSASEVESMLPENSGSSRESRLRDAGLRETVVDVCRRLGKPDYVSSRECCQVLFEDGSPEPSVVLTYLALKTRWFIDREGYVLADVTIKQRDPPPQIPRRSPKPGGTAGGRR